MTCERIQDRLVAHLDGELPHGERDWVADHLSICLPCARVARSHRMLGLSTPQPRVDTREPGFWDAMDHALRQEAMASTASGGRACGTGDRRWIALLH